MNGVCECRHYYVCGILWVCGVNKRGIDLLGPLHKQRDVMWFKTNFPAYIAVLFFITVVFILLSVCSSSTHRFSGASCIKKEVS